MNTDFNSSKHQLVQGRRESTFFVTLMPATVNECFSAFVCNHTIKYIYINQLGLSFSFHILVKTSYVTLI